jgi:hypothetical protein
MKEEVFSEFRLVGGTSLSLQLGHRISVDIDLFTDAAYGSIDFNKIENYLNNNFPFVEYFSDVPVAFGKSYQIGKNRNESVKLDVFYTDNFIKDFISVDEIRLATIEEIVAMKLDVIQRGGRKKDFWDIHELIGKFTFREMLFLHKQRYPYTHDEDLIIENFTNFSIADQDFEPICLRGKYWEFIKDDLIIFVNQSGK